jgi:hypothetical protein
MIPSTLSHLQVNGRTQYLTYCLGRSSSAVPVFVSPPAPGMMRETIGEFVAMGEPVERDSFRRLVLPRAAGYHRLDPRRLATFRPIPDMTDEPIPPREFRAMKGAPLPAVRTKDRSINVHLLEPPK